MNDEFACFTSKADCSALEELSTSYRIIWAGWGQFPSNVQHSLTFLFTSESTLVQLEKLKAEIRGTVLRKAPTADILPQIVFGCPMLW